jgi:hypothetical protein
VTVGILSLGCNNLQTSVLLWIFKMMTTKGEFWKKTLFGVALTFWHLNFTFKF